MRLGEELGERIEHTFEGIEGKPFSWIAFLFCIVRSDFTDLATKFRLESFCRIRNGGNDFVLLTKRWHETVHRSSPPPSFPSPFLVTDSRPCRPWNFDLFSNRLRRWLKNEGSAKLSSFQEFLRSTKKIDPRRDISWRWPCFQIAYFKKTFSKVIRKKKRFYRGKIFSKNLVINPKINNIIRIFILDRMRNKINTRNAYYGRSWIFIALK